MEKQVTGSVRLMGPFLLWSPNKTDTGSTDNGCKWSLAYFKCIYIGLDDASSYQSPHARGVAHKTGYTPERTLPRPPSTEWAGHHCNGPSSLWPHKKKTANIWYHRTLLLTALARNFRPCMQATKLWSTPTLHASGLQQSRVSWKNSFAQQLPTYRSCTSHRETTQRYSIG